MRLSWNWLAEMADLTGVDPVEASALLALRTADVESVEKVGGALDAVVTARVEKVEPHPGADRLRLCTVSTGAAAPLRVVCGAPNVAEGQVVCFAPVGTTLPNGVTLKKAKIRGVESEGMICAEDEMGLGTAHDGIVVLPAGTAVGVPVSKAMGLSDVVLDVANSGITNRPDLWGHVGFAREVAAIHGRSLRLPVSPRAERLISAATGEAFPVEVESAEDCRRYVAVVVEGVVNGPSPDRVRRRLEALGLRSVDLVVDLSNLVMLEQGQPLHAFDLREVRGAIRVRRAKAGETTKFLDGKERALHPEDLVIADRERVLALAGVLGGEGSGVREGTTAILLESATFDGPRVRRAAIRHGLRTDASSRFEKSLDPEAARAAAARFVELLLEHVPGARVTRRVTDVFGKPHPPVSIDLVFDVVRSRLGLSRNALPDDEITRLLASVGFASRPVPHGVRVSVPSWRATKDVSIPEDLVEDVGRLHGYDRVLPQAPLSPMQPTRPPASRRLERRTRAAACLDLGYAEVAAHAFHGDVEARALGLDPATLLRVSNPQASDQDRMQATSLQNLLRAAAKNQPRESSLALAEWTRAFPAAAPGAPHGEVSVLGLLRAEREPAGDAAEFLTAKEDALAVLRRAGSAHPRVSVDVAGAFDRAGDAWTHPGRRAALVVGPADHPTVVGGVSEVHPRVVRSFGLAGRAAFAEIELDAVVRAGVADPPYAPPPKFPTSTFDVAVVVPSRTSAAEVEATLRSSSADAVRGVALFDAYAGKGIPEGHRSLAFTVEFGASDGTLSPKAVEALQRRAIQTLEKKGWKVRTGEAPPAA